MTVPELTVIGLMSGTSVDSIDAAAVRIQMTEEPLALAHWELLATHTLDMPPNLRDDLLQMMREGQAPLATVSRLHRQVGEAFAQAAIEVQNMLRAKGLKADLLASHGQTIWHTPPVQDQLGDTLQIGQPAIMAERTGLPVVADFRPADMAAGGHGAPLVPFADQLLFQAPAEAIAVQNIGGIANVTALPPVGSALPVIAFDTGPGNMVIDALMQVLYQKPYDEGGEIAAQGHAHPDMMAALMADPYFTQPPPKSTGRERYGQQFAQQLLSQWQATVSPADLIATVTQWTVDSIAHAYRQFLLPKYPLTQAIVGGGGVCNQTLMQALSAALAPDGIQVRRCEEWGVPGKFKEAIAFAILGYATAFGIANNVPTCTGAVHPVCLGAAWGQRHPAKVAAVLQ